jgi:hypothetical protein
MKAVRGRQQKTVGIFLECLSNIIQEAINKFLPGWGFTLLVFEFRRKGITSYMSSAERTTMIESLKEMVEVLERDKDYPMGPPGPLH